MIRKIFNLVVALLLLAPMQSMVVLANTAEVSVTMGDDLAGVQNEIIAESTNPSEEIIVELPVEEESPEVAIPEVPGLPVIDEVNDDADIQSVAEVAKKEFMEVPEDEGVSAFSRSAAVQFAWINANKCGGEATISLYSPENPKEKHSYLPCEYQLSEYLGVNPVDSNYYDIRLQGGVYAIHKDRVQMMNLSSVKSAPYYENIGGRVVHTLENNPAKDNSYWTTKYLGTAPSWMKTGTRYYSFSGIYFVDSLQKLGNRDMKANAVNASTPYYDYFIYLPLRTKTNYSAAELNQMFNYMFDKSGYSGKKTVMRNLGAGLKSAEEKYGVNALVLLAMGIHESAYGTSTFAVDRNNLFGIGAVDSNPGEAGWFKSVAECLEYQADDLSWSYGDAAHHSGFKYYGFNIGTKSSGMNVRYASDPLWGESIANYMYEMDKNMGNKDNTSQSYAIVPQGAKVFKQSNGTGELHSYKWSTSLLTYMYPVATLATSGDYTKIRLEPADASQSGKYTWNREGYMKTSELIIVKGVPVVVPPEPEPEPEPPVEPKGLITYETHVSNMGWLAAVGDGKTGGTTGQFKQMEAMKIKLGSGISGSIEYRSHLARSGWETSWAKNGAQSGTSGQERAMEAVQLKLSGDAATKYDVYYRVHSADFGWLGWAKNGASAGTQGHALRMEAIEVVLVTKGGNAPGSTANPFIEKIPDLEYIAHVGFQGWLKRVVTGQTAGTVGQNRKMEAFKLMVVNAPVSGNVEYRSHRAGPGWETGWKRNDQVSGTIGQSRQIEAIQIRLTGELADKYDVYYRVHSASIGWNGWAKNGASAGTAGYALQAEAIQVRLVLKGEKAPGTTVAPYREKKQ